MAAIRKSAILNSAIMDSANLHKKKLDSFILTQLDDGSHLEFCCLEFGHLVFCHLNIFFQTDSHFPRLVTTICTKNLHSFILTQLDDGSHLEFCQLNIFFQTDSHFPRLVTTICTKNLHSFILTQLDDGSHLEFCHLNIFFQTDSHFPRLVPTIFTKHFTHSFWLNLMMAAILTFTMLGSDTAILDSDTLLSSLRLTQKHSHSTLTLTLTNSIWLKLIHFHLTWWWEASWILPPWIWPSWILPS